MKHPTTLKDREEIVALKVGGASHRAVATKTGWHIDTVRKVWRQYRRQGQQGLQAGQVGRPRRGAAGFSGHGTVPAMTAGKPRQPAGRPPDEADHRHHQAVQAR